MSQNDGASDVNKIYEKYSYYFISCNINRKIQGSKWLNNTGFYTKPLFPAKVSQEGIYFTEMLSSLTCVRPHMDLQMSLGSKCGITI